MQKELIMTIAQLDIIEKRLDGTIIVRCTKCGRKTEWYEDLDIPPLCVKCWDRDSLKDYKEKVAAAKRAYREQHPEKVAAAQRAYREQHPEKVAAAKRAWYETNKEKVAAAQRAWYETNKEKVAAAQRAYREQLKGNICQN